MSAAIGKTPEQPVSPPDLTYTKNRKSNTQTTDNTTPTAVISVSSPQAAVSPGETLSVLLTIRNTGSVPLRGTVAEVCSEENVLELIQGTVWTFSDNGEPKLLVPRSDEGVLLDIPGTIDAGKSIYVTLTFRMSGCDFPERVTLGAVLYADGMQAVSANNLNFPVCCANIESRKECIRGSDENHATFRIILTNTGTGSACEITLEDRLPDGFSVDHVLYSGFELAENVQYTIVGNVICVHLPTCIRPQTAGELTVTGHYNTNT